MKFWLALVTLFFSLNGCVVNDFSCLIGGDNLRGRITYGDGITIDKGNELVIEYQYGSSFAQTAAIPSQYTTKRNLHGLLSFEYSLCVDNNRDVVVRAYEDANGNRMFDSGEAHGIYDGTSNGDSAPTPINVERIQDHWNQKKGMDFFIDSL